MRIPAGSTSIVTHVTIELTIRAGSEGIVMLPVPIVWVFDRIELLAESGATLISRHEPSISFAPPSSKRSLASAAPEAPEFLGR